MFAGILLFVCLFFSCAVDFVVECEPKENKTKKEKIDKTIGKRVHCTQAYIVYHTVSVFIIFRPFEHDSTAIVAYEFLIVANNVDHVRNLYDSLTVSNLNGQQITAGAHNIYKPNSFQLISA